MSASDGWKADRIGSARAGADPTVLAKMAQFYAVTGDTQFLRPAAPPTRRTDG